MHNVLCNIMYGQNLIISRFWPLSFYTWLPFKCITTTSTLVSLCVFLYVCYLNDFGCPKFKTTFFNTTIVSFCIYCIPKRDYTVRGQSNVWRLPKFWTHPLTARLVCTPPPLVRGDDTLTGWRGGGGSIVRKPDTALYSIYVSTLCYILYCIFMV